eukprot:TRINITY_DN12619_c0_g1_i1.p1 TRINITY_DN12619_c0_g1~~TRINITY_DN12619_c0_g1_i1.p1  ORF type:complete len:293 (-),score=64.79 TRINITY_DN12619_c0_g1_i1:313-1170(-)
MEVFSNLISFVSGGSDGGKHGKKKKTVSSKKSEKKVSWHDFEGSWTLDNAFTPAKELYTIGATGDVSIVGAGGGGKMALAGSKGDTEKDNNYQEAGMAFLKLDEGKWQYLWVTGNTLRVHSFDSTAKTSGRSPRGSPHFVRASEGQKGMDRITTDDFRQMRREMKGGMFADEDDDEEPSQAKDEMDSATCSTAASEDTDLLSSEGLAECPKKKKVVKKKSSKAQELAPPKKEKSLTKPRSPSRSPRPSDTPSEPASPKKAPKPSEKKVTKTSTRNKSKSPRPSDS